MVTDDEYPVRVAFGLLNKITDEFQEQHPKDKYERDVANARMNAAAGAKFREIDWPTLNTYLQKYQDPKQADTIMRVQQELDETKIILVRVSPLSSLLLKDWKKTEYVPCPGSGSAAPISTRRSNRCSSEGRSSTVSSTGRTT